MSVKRQRVGIVVIGGMVILTILYYLFVLSPSLSRERALRKRMEKKESEVVQMLRLNIERGKLLGRRVRALDLLKRRGKNFALLSFLELLSRKVGISGRIQYMKPVSFLENTSDMVQTGVELRLDGVTMDELVRYLYLIEYSKKLLAIPRVKVQRFKGKGGVILLRVTMQVTTYAQKSNTGRISSL